MSCYARGARIEQKTGSNLDHDQTVVSATDRGEHETTAFSSFFGCIAEIN